MSRFGPGGAWWFLLAGLAALPALAAVRAFPQHPAAAALGALGLLGAMTWAVTDPAAGACALILIVYWNLSDVVTAAWGFAWVLRLAIVLTAGAWLLRRLLESYRPAWRWPLIVPAAIYGAAQAASLAFSADRSTASLTLFEYAKGLAVFYLVVNLLTTPRQWRRGVLALLVAVVALSLPVIYQGLTGSHDILYGFGSLKYAEIVPGEWGWRLGGALQDPNFLAMVLVASLPLAAVQALEPHGALGRRLLGAAALVTTLAATVYTYSRASALGIAFLALGLVWKHRQRKLALAWMVLLVAAAAPFAPAGWLARLGTLNQASLTRQQQEIADTSIQVRRNEIFTGLLMFAGHPLLGIGPGNYPEQYQEYSARLGLTSETGMREAHSLYVEIAAETGLAGLVAFGALLVGAFARMRRGRERLRRLGAHAFADQVWALEMAIATYLLLSVFLHGAYFRHFLVLLALGALGAQLAMAPRAAPSRRAAGGAA